MRRLRSSALLERGMPGITNMRFSDEGMKFECGPYRDAELYELLHVLRPLVLAREATSFERVAGLLGRRFSSKELAMHLRFIRNIFEHGEHRLYMQITLGTQPLFDHSLIHTWLNGTQYHTDAEKAATWRDIEKSLGQDNARALVMNQLQGRVKALFLLEHLVQMVRKHYAGT